MVSVSNVLEISGVLLQNEIKNIYCFLKMRKKKIIPSALKLTAERPDDRVPGDGWRGAERALEIFLGAIRCH